MNKLNILFWAILMIGGYTLGSVMFSKEIPKLLGYGDITEKSNDRNPGASNVFKNCGVVCGMACLFCDMLKGFLPIFIANLFFGIDNVRFAVVMMMPVLGHAFPALNHWKGGKMHSDVVRRSHRLYALFICRIHSCGTVHFLLGHSEDKSAQNTQHCYVPAVCRHCSARASHISSDLCCARMRVYLGCSNTQAHKNVCTGHRRCSSAGNSGSS